jgi:cold shock CspA family protein
MNGTIKRLVDGKRFGFILASDGNEYFFSQLGLRPDALRRGS